jgi:hypothetical protein
MRSAKRLVCRAGLAVLVRLRQQPLQNQYVTPPRPPITQVSASEKVIVLRMAKTYSRSPGLGVGERRSFQRSRSGYRIAGTRGDPSVGEQSHRHPRRPAGDDEAADQDEQTDDQYEQSHSELIALRRRRTR